MLPYKSVCFLIDILHVCIFFSYSFISLSYLFSQPLSVIGTFCMELVFPYIRFKVYFSAHFFFIIRQNNHLNAKRHTHTHTRHIRAHVYENVMSFLFDSPSVHAQTNNQAIATFQPNVTNSSSTQHHSISSSIYERCVYVCLLYKCGGVSGIWGCE